MTIYHSIKMIIIRYRTVLLILPVVFTLSSCHIAKQNSELRIIPRKDDSVANRQEISKIKSMDNSAFAPGKFTDQNGMIIQYRLYSPDAKRLTQKKWPLVIIFHGSGQTGTDNTTQLGLLPKLFAGKENQCKHPSYVLAPQFSTRSSDYVMDSTLQVLSSAARPCLRSFLALVDSLKNNLNIDHQRIYVVGYSMGGSTVINALIARPELFAAGISIAGIPQFAHADQLRSTPLWLIHGLNDLENHISSDNMLYTVLKKYHKIRFWKFEERAHHDLFCMQLLGTTLPDWLYRQHKK